MAGNDQQNTEGLGSTESGQLQGRVIAAQKLVGTHSAFSFELDFIERERAVLCREY
jgi:hypothetical protein